MTSTTASEDRASAFLRKAELEPPPNIPLLPALSKTDHAISESDLALSRSILVATRTKEDGYKPPEQKKRYFLKGEKWKKEKANFETWVFTKYEVAKAFNTLLGQKPLAAVGVAQALLSHADSTTIDELWCHLHDKKLEKRMLRPFFPRKSLSETLPLALTWLDLVTNDNQLEYISLLCLKGVAQDHLERAFNIALSKNSMDAMTILLRSGVVASSFHAAIREQVGLDNLELVKLLLSVPSAMSVDAWRQCLEVEMLKESPDIFLQCLAQRPDIASARLLLLSLSAQNFAATTITLAYATMTEEFMEAREPACRLAAKVEDDRLRLNLFSVLGKSGLLADMLLLREELMRDVQSRQFELVQLLIEAQVSVDIEPNNALYWTMSRLDIDLLKLFGQSACVLSATLLLEQVPATTSESDMLQVLDIFGHRGLAGESMDVHLISAVQKEQTVLVKQLLFQGASTEFQGAAAIRAALEKPRFDLLEMLLGYKCSPEILSLTIPTAMEMRVRSERLQAMQSLTQKGIVSKELGIPLRKVVAEEGSLDYELVSHLLQHKAPLNGDDDDGDDNDRNPLLVAVRKGLVPLLQLLCEAGPRKNTLSIAIPIAFKFIDTHSYDITFDMMKVLLQYGATGEPVHQTLLTAASSDRELRIISLLLDYGADSNYKLGASFRIAIELANFELLQLLCTKCPPTLESTEDNLFIAVMPKYFNLQALNLLLRSTPNVNVVLDESWSSERFRNNCHRIQIARCFLRHGMNVDLGNGSLACLAIQECESELLREVLAAKPNLLSLTEAFKEVSKIQERNTIILYSSLLLNNAKSAEIGQTLALPEETLTAINGDSALFNVLLAHGADVNSEEGLALQMASSAGCLKTMHAILACHPTMRSITSACLATASSTMIDWNQKDVVFRCMLDSHGAVASGSLTFMLAKTIELLPGFTQLPKLLLARGAVASIRDLKVASVKSPQALFTMLADSVLSNATLSQLLRYSCDQKMQSDRRYWIYKYLVGRGVNKDDISEALLNSLTAEDVSDLSLSKLLLDNGASLKYKNGAAFDLAFALDSSEVVHLLSHYIDNDQVANIGFHRAWTNPFLSNDTRYAVYQCFLEWQITKRSIQRALVENLEAGVLDVDIVELLLRYGADPNEDNARCFTIASSMDAEDEYRALSRYGSPDLELILKSLIQNFKAEWKVVKWLSIYIEENLPSKLVCRENLLFQCLRNFPDGTSLLKLLLARGLSTGAKLKTPICPGWEPEMCTAVIWALRSAKPRIGNAPILTLLLQGKAKALPAYSTPISKVSAAFACTIDDTRTEVLKTLLEIDIDGVMGHTMPESKFTYMAARPEVEESDSSVLENTNELTVLSASIYAGNFQAFYLMRSYCEPDDGTLTMAVLLALPKFIQWLLANGHDPNYRDEATNMMIPLALLCSAKYAPYCKIANREGGLSARRREAMKLLAPKTDLSLKYRGKTVLHYALDEGPEVTKAMIEALNLRLDKRRNVRYIYVDKDRIHYSPDQYVEHIMKIDEAQKVALVDILKACGMTSHYYKDVKPGEGQQPVGYKGLPAPLKLLWESAANKRMMNNTQRAQMASESTSTNISTSSEGINMIREAARAYRVYEQRARILEQRARILEQRARMYEGTSGWNISANGSTIIATNSSGGSIIIRN